MKIDLNAQQWGIVIHALRKFDSQVLQDDGIRGFVAEIIEIIEKKRGQDRV